MSNAKFIIGETGGQIDLSITNTPPSNPSSDYITLYTNGNALYAINSTGSNIIIGETGPAGSAGTSGTSGISGTSGTSGLSGSSGTSGTSGQSGSSGTSGTSGANGSSGTSGTSGTSFSSPYTGNLEIIGQAVSRLFSIGTTGGSVTLNWNNSNVQTLTLSSSISSLTKSNPINGGVYTVFVTQGGTGSYTVNWGADVRWAGGTGPTLSTAVGATDAVTLVYVAGITGYYGNANLNFA